MHSSIHEYLLSFIYFMIDMILIPDCFYHFQKLFDRV